MSKCILCGEALGEGLKFTDILFIRRPSGVCQECFHQFESIGDERCSRCCKKGPEKICLDCQEWEKKGEMVRHDSLFAYNEAMADYISRYKFQGDYLLRKVFVKEIRTYLQAHKGYTIVPIPLSLQRYQERGFNQVQGLLAETGFSIVQLLKKEEIAKQSEKTRQERLQLQQPFSLATERKMPAKILLVDDIYTTGATIHLAKQLLLEKGAKEVRTFSLAR